MKKRLSHHPEPANLFQASSTSILSGTFSKTSIAWHEAGHVVAILKLGLPLFSAKIYGDGTASGEVVCGVCENRISEIILSLHCGLAAERLICLEAPDHHGESDSVAARNLTSNFGLEKNDFESQAAHFVRRNFHSIRNVAEALAEFKNIPGVEVEKIISTSDRVNGTSNRMRGPELVMHFGPQRAVLSPRDLLNSRRLPGRLLAEEAMALLGFQLHDMPILLAAKLLKPLGRPSRNAPKLFASSEILEKINDQHWLNQATVVVSGHWSKRNNRVPDIDGKRQTLKAVL